MYNTVTERVDNEFPYNVANGSCINLDKYIKDIRDKIVKERITPTPYNYGTYKNSPKTSVNVYIQALVDKKAFYESAFARNDCSDKIEKLRQNESAVLLTKQSIEQEMAVLKPANIDQRIYIGVGALILLVGLYIVVKK